MKGKKINQKIALEKIKKRLEETGYVLLNTNYCYNVGHSDDNDIHIYCPKHDIDWWTSYNRFVNANKTGCTKCNKFSKKTHNEAFKNLKKRLEETGYVLLNIDYKYYPGHQKDKNIHLFCLKHDIDWWTSYEKFVTGNRNCKKCGHEKCGKCSLKDIEDVKFEINKHLKKHNLILLNPDFIYINMNKTMLNIYCPKHNIKRIISCNDLLITIGCKECSKEQRINTAIEHYGEIWFKCVPSHNPNSIIYLDLISEKVGLKIQHALNGGEKKFHRYWVDGYIEEYNICIEWNEKHHYNKRKREKDLNRENYIKDNFNCSNYEINEKEFLKDPENNIIKVTEEIQQLINSRKVTI